MAFWNPRCYQHLRCLYFYECLFAIRRKALRLNFRPIWKQFAHSLTHSAISIFPASFNHVLWLSLVKYGTKSDFFYIRYQKISMFAVSPPWQVEFDLFFAPWHPKKAALESAGQSNDPQIINAVAKHCNSSHMTPLHLCICIAGTFSHILTPRTQLSCSCCCSCCVTEKSPVLLC